MGLAQGHFAGAEHFRFPEVFDTIQKADVEACIRRWVVPEHTGLSIVEPKEARA